MSQPAAEPPGHRLIQWATLLAGVSLVLVIVNIVLAVIDRNAQAEVNRRQQQIAQAAQLEAVAKVMTRALTTQAEASQDKQLQDLLANAGISGAAPPKPAASATKP